MFSELERVAIGTEISTVAACPKYVGLALRDKQVALPCSSILEPPLRLTCRLARNEPDRSSVSRAEVANKLVEQLND